MRGPARLAGRAAAAAAVGLIRCYQAWVSPLLGPTCRFTPTCSEYAVGAVRKYGVLRGTLKTARRLARCHPLHPGGYDPP